jgi:hypothetical protein
MDRRINTKIENFVCEYKKTIKNNFLKSISAINDVIDESSINENNIIKDKISKVMMNSLQELYDYETFRIDKNDLLKRKRTKNVIPLHERCMAYRANGDQCTRRCKNGTSYCGTHSKGTPHGIVNMCTKLNSNEHIDNMKKVEVTAQDIKGIIYYIDNNFNVYNTEDIHKNINNPNIIAKYSKSIDSQGNIVYSIPEFNI